MSVVFELLKMSFWVPKKVSYHFQKGDKTKGEYSSSPGINEQINIFSAT